MAKFSSIYKQSGPTVRTVQGENTFEKGMYWTNSVVEQGYVHTLLNYDIDTLNSTLTVSKGFSSYAIAHGCSFIDHLEFNKPDSGKILVTQPRNTTLLDASNGLFNILSLNKITVKNNQILKESLQEQGFVPEDVTCYKALLYNPDDLRLIVVTFLQASRDKYFIIDDKYQTHRLMANPISCGKSDYYIPRYYRNNFRSTFNQPLYTDRFMRSVLSCEGLGNKSFCFTKKKIIETPLDHTKLSFKPINTNYTINIEKLNKFIRDVLAVGYIREYSKATKLKLIFGKDTDPGQLNPELASTSCTIDLTTEYLYIPGVDERQGWRVTSAGSFEFDTAFPYLWKFSLYRPRKEEDEEDEGVDYYFNAMEIGGKEIIWIWDQNAPEYNHEVIGATKDYIIFKRAYPSILELDNNTRFIGNLAIGMYDSETAPVEEYARDAYRYGALLTCCYLYPYPADVFAFRFNKHNTQPKDKNAIYDQRLVTELKTPGIGCREKNTPPFELDLTDGSISYVESIESASYSFGIFRNLERKVSDPSFYWTDGSGPKPVFNSKVSGAISPVDYLTEDILNSLQVGQCLRVAAYCKAKQLTNSALTESIVNRPEYRLYLNGDVTAVYVLNYIWNGAKWEFSFINTDYINEYFNDNGTDRDWTLIPIKTVNEDSYCKAHIYVIKQNQLVYTDFLNKQNLSTYAKTVLDLSDKKHYIRPLDKEEVDSYNNGKEINLDLGLSKQNRSLFYDTQQALFEIKPKALIPSEAALWGYNMLSANPYGFSCLNTPGTSTAYFTGILLKDTKDNSKVLLNAVLNTPGVLEIYFNSDFSYFENVETPTLQLKVEYKNPIDDWRILRDYTIADTKKLLKGPAPIRIPFTGVDETTIFRITLTDTNPKKAIEVPVNNGAQTEKVFLIVHQMLYTISYSKAPNKFAQDTLTYDLGSATGLTIWKNRLVLWGVLDANNMLFLSEPNEPSYFPYPNNVDIFDEDIIHLVKYSDALLVFTSTKLWRIDLNADGISWTKTLLQQNIRTSIEDIPYITVVKNMLFFKSGDQFYMLVPTKSSTVGELSIAPISNAISGFLKDPFKAIRSLLETVYPNLAADSDKYTHSPITHFLIKYGTHVEKSKIFVDWWFDLGAFEGSENSKYMLVQLVYDTASYGWRMFMHFTNSISYFISDVANDDIDIVNLVYCPSFRLSDDVEINSTWGIGVSKRYNTEELLFESYKHNFDDKEHGIELFKHDYPRIQVLDTGYKEVTTPALKKRFREIQLMFEADSDNLYGLKALYDFMVDGHSLLSSVKQEVKLVDKLDHSGNVISKELQLIDTLNLFENGDENLLGNRLDSTFSLDFTALTDTKKVKIRKQVSGKGYLARAKFTNLTNANYRITSYAFISHNKNAR